MRRRAALGCARVQAMRSEIRTLPNSNRLMNIMGTFYHDRRDLWPVRPPVETGVWHAKPAEARLSNGAIAVDAVSFNALGVSDEGFNLRRRGHAPT